MSKEPERISSIKFITDHRKHLLENWPPYWPGKDNHIVQHDVTLQQYRLFVELVERKAGEREIEKLLQRKS